MLARRLLRGPLARPHDDLRFALAVVHLLPVPLAAGQLRLRVDEVALLLAQVRLGDAHHPRGGLLFDGEGFLVRGEVAAVPGELPGAQIGDLVDAVEEFAVVADHHQRARPGPRVHRLVQPAARVQVEVVGGLVEQQHVGAAQQQGGQPEQDGLAARDLAERAVQADVAEAQLAEDRERALLDVPVVADGREVFLGHVARLDGVQRGAHGGDAERLVDTQGGVERDVLRQVPDLAGDADGAVGRGELPGEQLQQGRLPRAVDADESGAAGAERGVETVQDGGAVRPGEGQGRTGDRGMHTGLAGA